MSDVRPKVASIVNATIRVNATGLSLTTPVECWLTLVSTFQDGGGGGTAPSSSGNLTLNVSVSAASISGSSDLTILTLHLDYADTPGVYSLRCMAAHVFEMAAAENGSLIHLVDYNILQLSNVDPNAIVLGDGQATTVRTASHSTHTAGAS